MQFLDRFFVDGVLHDGHVRPQSEYFVKPYGNKCLLAVDFVGKMENVVGDWKRFLDSQQCHVTTQFNLTAGRHNSSSDTKHALADAAGIVGLPLLSSCKQERSSQWRELYICRGPIYVLCAGCIWWIMSCSAMIFRVVAIIQTCCTSPSCPTSP